MPEPTLRELYDERDELRNAVKAAKIRREGEIERMRVLGEIAALRRELALLEGRHEP